MLPASLPILHPNPTPTPPPRARPFLPPILHRRHRRCRHLTLPIRSSSQIPDSTNLDPLTTAARLLWGGSLPPSPLISLARTSWSAAWHLMMRQLAPSSASGSYSRPPSPFPSVPSSYLSHPPLHLHLYAAFPCPWAHRTLIVRALRLPSLPLSLAVPGVTTSWEFRPPSSDLAHSLPTLSHVYSLRPGGFSGRPTVPMLWDPIRRDVVCNDSYAIIEFLNSVAPPGRDLAPPHLRDDIRRWNRLVHSSINNGVYRCGFAQSQAAYDIAVEELFAALEAVEANLSSSRFLCGDELTLADVCLFPTLIRFDAVYHVLFRCMKRKLVEYPNLHRYTREIYQMPEVKETCDLEAIRDGYYGSLFPLNPSGIRPAMPDSAREMELLSLPHNTGAISSSGRKEHEANTAAGG